MTRRESENNSGHQAPGNNNGDGEYDFKHHFFMQSVRSSLAARRLDWPPETCARAVELAIASLTKETWDSEFRRVLVAGNFGDPAYLDCRRILADATSDAVRAVLDEEMLAVELGAVATKIRNLDQKMIKILIFGNVKKIGFEEIASRLGLESAEEARSLFFRGVAELNSQPPGGRPRRDGPED